YFDGLTTRGVLLDVAAGRTEGYVTVGQPVTPKELDAVAARAGVKIEPGDVVVVRNGDEAFRKANPDWVPRVAPHPGMHLSCLEWFREKDIAAIAWDMMDERPTSYPGFAMSTHLAIPFLGLVLVDNTNPERLARACAEEGRYEFLFTATPIRLVGSTGAPAHPVAQQVSLERRAHLLAHVRARIRERRERPRVPQHAEHVLRVLVDERLHEHLIVVLEHQVDHDLDRVAAKLRRQLGDRRVVPVHSLHDEEVRVVGLPRIGGGGAAALEDIVARLHAGLLGDQLPARRRVG